MYPLLHRASNEVVGSAHFPPTLLARIRARYAFVGNVCTRGSSLVRWQHKHWLYMHYITVWTLQ